LWKRGGNWHYLRRVPVRFRAFDPRSYIRLSLKTRSIVLARERRDAMDEANNVYWARLVDIGVNG